MNQNALTVEGLNAFLSKVFIWMFMGLITTAITAAVVASTPSLIYAIASNRLLFFGLMIGEIFLVVKISRNALKYTFQKTTLMFFLYAILNGITLSIYFYAYTSQSIASAFGITAVIFGIMAFYGYVTKADLTSFGTIAMIGIVGIVIATLVNMFLQSSMINYVVSIIGVVLFSGLTAYDMQKMKSLYAYSASNEGISEGNLAITGALTLYLDFINLFLFVLRLSGGRK